MDSYQGERISQKICDNLNHPEPDDEMLLDTYYPYSSIQYFYTYTVSALLSVYPIKNLSYVVTVVQKIVRLLFPHKMGIVQIGVPLP